MMTKTYLELIELQTFQERLDYLRIGGVVGEQTFGYDRYLNQNLYHSNEWKSIRRKIIIRDNGCDLESISWDGLAKGLVGVGVLMGEILAFMKIISGFEKKAKFASVGVVLLATSILILANAVEKFGEMDWESIGKGLAGIGGLLTELAVFSNFSGKAKHVMSTGAAMVLLGASMKIFASAVKDFGSMQWETIGNGLLAMAGALTEITVALNFMPKNMLGNWNWFINRFCSNVSSSQCIQQIRRNELGKHRKGRCCYGRSISRTYNSTKPYAWNCLWICSITYRSRSLDNINSSFKIFRKYELGEHCKRIGYDGRGVYCLWCCWSINETINSYVIRIVSFVRFIRCFCLSYRSRVNISSDRNCGFSYCIIRRSNYNSCRYICYYYWNC